MIEIIFIVALVVLFIHVTFWEGQIFEKIAEKLKDLPDYIKKPLYDCPICQTPWYGSLILLIGNLTNTWNINNWFYWILIVFAAGGLNAIFIYIINQGKAISKVLDEYECNCTKKEDKDLERKERLANYSGKIEAGNDKANNVLNTDT